jgi:hypothetical protein
MHFMLSVPLVGVMCVKGAIMAIYRCYFCNKVGSITDWKALDCDTDAEAEQLSTTLLAERPQHYSVEVWDLGRRAFHHARKVAASSAA